MHKYILCSLLLLTSTYTQVKAQSFVHPGGLHTQADLDRMKAKVAAGAHPWIDDWNRLIADPQARNTYTPAPRANMGGSRQRASADAHAAYLNALRWYISGDTSYADCAIRICNAWSAAVNQVPTGTDIPGLSGIPIFEFALAAELLRISPRWAPADFTQFKDMMITYWYPVCHNFLTNHNGACITNYWANWDACNIGAILTIGVLCDDTAKYNEAITYYKTGPGAGSIANAVYVLHPGGLGQWQESGRDQEHAQLGVGLLASVCEVAWNQGLDLYSYDNNRLLAGAEYVAKTNLWNEVPYTAYNNCKNANQRWVSINGRGRLDDRPIWEMIYNHYVVRKGLSAPNTQAMAQLMRPEHGSADHFGYGTLAFTLDAAASPYPPLPTPAAPAGLTATAGISRVWLKWTAPPGNTAQGYIVKRADANGGPYTTIASWTDNTTSSYVDGTVTNGNTYYYVVSAVNQSGSSSETAAVNARPQAASDTLPTGWSRQDIGSVTTAGTSSFAAVAGNSFVVTGAGTDISGTADAFAFTCKNVTGNATITTRLSAISGSLRKAGIMIRESLAPDAKTFFMKLGDAGWRQAAFGARTATAGSMTWTGGNDYTWLPAWFRLTRNGSTFTAYESTDGVNWLMVGTATTSMSNSYYIGVAVSSGSATALNTSTFDNVSVVLGQSISFNALPAKRPGDTAFDAGAVSSAGLPVSYSSTDTTIATIIAGKIQVKGAGSCTIVATQPGDSLYAAADTVSQLLESKPLQLQVQYKDGDDQHLTNNMIKPFFKIINADSVGFPYGELTARYWLTAENYNGAVNNLVDYTQLGSGKVKMKYAALPNPHHGAYGYIEYSFDSTAGNLLPNHTSGEIKSRFGVAGWPVLNESDDYSYQAQAAYAVNNHFTLYRNGILVQGAEPEIIPDSLQVKVYFQNRNTVANTNTISHYIRVNNTGNVPLAYKDLSFRYWFTKDGNAALNSSIEYAAIGTGNVTRRFVAVNPAADSADTYFDLQTDSAAGILYPLANTGNIQYRISKSDWSKFNELNDYSYKPAGAFGENERVTVYYKDQLIYGTEPFPAASLKNMVAYAPAEELNTTLLYPNPLTGREFYVRVDKQLLQRDLRIVVYDMNGKSVHDQLFQKNTSGVVTVQLDKQVAAGVYMVQLNKQPATRIVINP
ncbi:MULTISPECIES: cellulose binding domain-containing protein [unclassified Chitinophaga]|uniref:cellulose binding domain-containing protein n=1 Tax=unclassified Chitinophaga TaxID=2619133 RepID=UPI00300F7E72